MDKAVVIGLGAYAKTVPFQVSHTTARTVSFIC